MGDPRRLKKNYSGPRHPWIKEQLEQEKIIKTEYGLRSKKEIHKVISKLKDFQDEAKRLIASRDEQSEKETTQILSRLQRLGLLPAGAQLNDILRLTLKDIMERRLQTLVFRKGLARTVNQSRQFITHNHILCKNNIINAPGYLVLSEEETTLAITPRSTLSSEDHPVRVRGKAPAATPVATPAATPAATATPKTEPAKEEA